MDWKKAYCKGADPDIFSEPDHEDTAKGYCQRCPITVQCLDWAMKNNEEGVWGGTTDHERRALKRPGARRHCPGCGGTRQFSDGVYNICIGCGLSWHG